MKDQSPQNAVNHPPTVITVDLLILTEKGQHLLSGASHNLQLAPLGVGALEVHRVARDQEVQEVGGRVLLVLLEVGRGQEALLGVEEGHTALQGAGKGHIVQQEVEKVLRVL